MSMIRAGLTALALCLAPPLVAQDQITPEAFLDRVEGKTVTFRNFNTRSLVGIEQFERRDRTVWARSDGTCAYGDVTTQGDQLCFSYDDEPPSRIHCWLPFQSEDRLFVVDPSGSEIQEATRITTEPLACTPLPMS